ncbi:LPS export ABC transporter periplasmic protein LptC [Acidovorax sp. HDW3]|uniref:LPS export ABC transporter periplasmic protein LptC n=1 Tax=Acidovorax sp. HDW3 TaxID=2714923 RepID=UPI00140CB090|nr:LPS export ABC transporter periplasmic protein LptC [Acidovorax sp. HDW3]QIL45395.1 LPS export ABC transporter periplasmic protein LptC [Acidovorax sp. HDW3]
MSSALRRSWDRLSLYLPVLLMGLLAMGTWWLVRSAPRPPRPDVATVLRHEPDYSLRDFSVKTFGANGQLQSELQGQIGHHYPDTDTLEIEQVQMRSISPEGRVTTAHARRGLSNADGSEVQLFGDAVVTRAAQQLPDGRVLPRLQFEGEFLHAWTQDERVRSHLPVTLQRGTDRFTADRMDYDNMAQQMQLQGRVHGVLQPTSPARP